MKNGMRDTRYGIGTMGIFLLATLSSLLATFLICGSAFADNWSETVFTNANSTFTQTTTSTGAAEVILSKVPLVPVVWSTLAAAPGGIYLGGALCYPGSGDFIYGFAGNNVTDFYRCQVLGLASSGTYLSGPITPAGVSGWGILAYTRTTPVNTLLTVDVLSSSNNALLVANVPSGTNLQYTYPATFSGISGIKLRANLSTTDSSATPQLNDWTVEYATGSQWVNTANWTSIVKAANPVAMGNAVAVISFTAVAGGTATVHWRRLRIDETGGQPIEKLTVSVYEESGNDGFFDAGDRFIASGTFNSSRTCYLNMNRWPLGTTAKTYYIVEKVALDGSGGVPIRLNVADGSYFDFEEGPCVGVPP